MLRDFIVKEIRGRFAGSMAGVLWTLINPLATIIIYFFVFSIVLRIQVTVDETGTDSFAVYFLSGLFPWLLFSDGLIRSVGCIVNNANLIKKVAFPVEVLLAATVLTAFIVNGVGMLLFLVFLFFKGYVHITWFLVLILIPLQMLFTWGIASFVAAACVFIRDTSELLGIVLMLWFFATPIIYPLSMLPDKIRSLMAFNPVSSFVGLYRDALLTHQIHWLPVAQLTLISLLLYGIGVWFFMRAKPAFGDVL
ncbi:MAG: ABC transporter permease [Desulfobacterales bacterium]|nr:ABC transporter permease [Desulfobacterales bacterium]